MYNEPQQPVLAQPTAQPEVVNAPSQVEAPQKKGLLGLGFMGLGGKKRRSLKQRKSRNSKKSRKSKKINNLYIFYL